VCELGLERGWTDTVCWVHGQLDPCLGSHVKIVDEGKGNVNEHVLNETMSAKALQSSKMISIQGCELFPRLVFLEDHSSATPETQIPRADLPYQIK